jgi:OFA family oxalate/formate antiporter-like MFS transporter
MFLLQAAIFMLLPRVEHFAALAALSFVVLLCYGGGFGTMPAFAADIFGPTNIGSIYGLMLTAWGFAGVVGPTLIARIREATAHYGEALDLIAAIMLVGALIPLFVRSTRSGRLQPAIKPS